MMDLLISSLICFTSRFSRPEVFRSACLALPEPLRSKRARLLRYLSGSLFILPALKLRPVDSAVALCLAESVLLIGDSCFDIQISPVPKGSKTLDSTQSVFGYLKFKSDLPPKSLISVRSLTACIRFDEFAVRISKLLVKENLSLAQMQNDS